MDASGEHPGSDAMDDLIDLLTYTCPITGKKRTAGCKSSPEAK